jgi:hypothetical protein
MEVEKVIAGAQIATAEAELQAIRADAALLAEAIGAGDPAEAERIRQRLAGRIYALHGVLYDARDALPPG